MRRHLISLTVSLMLSGCGNSSPAPAPSPPQPCAADTQADRLNCGSCGNACPTDPNGNTSCVKGACQLECITPWYKCGPAPQTRCNVDASTDAKNCGGCGLACAAGKVCNAGSCS